MPGWLAVFQFIAIRHSAASVMIRNGVDLHTVAQVLGHSRSATTTRLYAHVDHAHSARSDGAGGRAIRIQLARPVMAPSPSRVTPTLDPPAREDVTREVDANDALEFCATRRSNSQSPFNQTYEVSTSETLQTSHLSRQFVIDSSCDA